MTSKDAEETGKRKITLPGLSQFSSLVDTNHVATDEQVSEINTLLGPHLQSLKSLEGELDKIGKIWADLSRQHASLLAEINTAREIIAPMRRVPTDVLQEIFHHCLPTKHDSVMSAEHCPLLLTRVCRSWRNIALATPSLWASLHIPVPSIPSNYSYGRYAIRDDHGEVAEAVGRRVTGMQEWLARSGACALSLSLSEEDAGAFPRSEFIIPVFLSFSSRWKDLIVSAPIERLSSLAAAVSDVPLLESLTLMRQRGPQSSFHVEANSSNVWDTMDLLKAPKLRKVSFERLWAILPPLPLRWSQLTSFTFKERYSGFSSPLPGEPPIFNVARMLQPCVHLTDLHLEFSSLSFDLQPLSDEAEELHLPFMLSLPLLERLIIYDGGNDTRRMSIFFNALQAPSLRFLEISASPPLSFFSRTPRLRHLHLHLDQFAQDNFIHLLRHCQYLTSLVTSRSAVTVHWGIEEFPQSHIFDDNVLNLFVSPGDGNEPPYFCPELEELECRSCAGFSDEGMVDFITRKRDGSVPGVAKLKRLHVAFDRARRSWTGEQSERFVQDGLQLFVSHLDRDPIPRPAFPAVAGIRNYTSWGQ